MPTRYGAAEALSQVNLPRAGGWLELLPGCPITDRDLRDVRNRRRAMLTNGYPVLAIHSPWSPYVLSENAGKQPLTEVINNKKLSWREHPHSLDRLRRVTRASANTGVVLGGAKTLAAFDIDPSKKSPEFERQRFAKDVVEIMRRDPVLGPLLTGRPGAALLRGRAPSSVLILLRTDKPTPKRKIQGGHGAVELLGEGQQFVVDGWHRYSIEVGKPVRINWLYDHAPWTVPADDLPVVCEGAIIAVLQAIEKSGVLGKPVLRPATTTTVVGANRPGHRSAVYPETLRLNELLLSHDGFVAPAVRELIAEVGAAGHDRHNALVAVAGRLIGHGIRWSDERIALLLIPLANQHFDDTDWSREVHSAIAHARGHDTAQVAAAPIGRLNARFSKGFRAAPIGASNQSTGKYQDIQGVIEVKPCSAPI